jgi:hypothetical protein
VARVALEPLSRRVAWACQDGRLGTIDQHGKPLGRSDLGSQPVGLAWMGRDRLAVASRGGDLLLLDAASRTRVRILRPIGDLVGLGVARDRFVAADSAGKVVRVAATGQVEGVQALSCAPRSFAVARHSGDLVVVDRAGYLHRIGYPVDGGWKAEVPGAAGSPSVSATGHLIAQPAVHQGIYLLTRSGASVGRLELGRAVDQALLDVEGEVLLAACPGAGVVLVTVDARVLWTDRHEATAIALDAGARLVVLGTRDGELTLVRRAPYRRLTDRIEPGTVPRTRYLEVGESPPLEPPTGPGSIVPLLVKDLVADGSLLSGRATAGPAAQLVGFAWSGHAAVLARTGGTLWREYLRGGEGEITFSPDPEDGAAVASNRRVAYLIRAGTGEGAVELPVAPRDDLRRVAFLDHGRSVLLCTAGGMLRALALDGRERWTRSTRGPLADLQVSPGGDRLAVIDARGEVLLLDAAGKLCWQADGRSRRARVAWLSDGGLALARRSDGRLLKLDPGGRQVWSRGLPQAAERLVGTSEGCLVLAGGRAERYDLTGSPRGKIRLDRGGSLAAVPGAPLVLLTLGRSAELRGLDGELQWVFEASGTIRTSDVAPDGSAVVIFDGRTLYLLQVREEIPAPPPPRRFIEL